MTLRIERVLMAALLAFLAVHAIGVGLDFVAAIRYPFELDYGEGIVWQQAALIPGPRMYGRSPELPFIVFHYPPLYYFLVRAAAWAIPDMLAAGRLVAAISTVLIAPLVAGLVLVATPHAGARRPPMQIAIAVATGLLVLCLHAVRTWGLLMRVDMPSVALGLAGVLVAARANGGLRGTACALLLCVASVYCKQTELPAGIAIFLVTLWRRPRAALAAAAIALVVGLAALGLLQVLTSGGFLHNIIGDNLNRFSPRTARFVFTRELSSLPFAAVMLVGFAAVLRGLGPRFLLADRAAAARAMIALHFLLATLMLVTVFKSGASFNYLLDWLTIGGVLIGVLLCELRDRRLDFALLVALTLAAVAVLPFRQLPDRMPSEMLAEQSALVARIAAADKPVASEDMVLLMRAGKPVIFEPAIVTELAMLGLWDENPLVQMIRAHGFAFMITGDDHPGGTLRRSPAVDAAMREAYPRSERIRELDLWLHLPG
jgi:hypothetical protein